MSSERLCPRSSRCGSEGHLFTRTETASEMPIHHSRERTRSLYGVGSRPATSRVCGVRADGFYPEAGTLSWEEVAVWRCGMASL